MTKSILISGVGGQGTLLASRILGAVAIGRGFDVKVSEVHGMSQRGGSVLTYVKYSDIAVYSPIIDEGRADYLLAFELLEAYRSLKYLKPGGKMLTSRQQINPMPVITGAETYPPSIEEQIANLGVDITALDALQPALEAGSAKTVNVVLLGALSGFLGFSEAEWRNAIQATVKPQFAEINRKAFEAGRASVINIL
ncbi:MAG: indolepyruvate oxidoreductase subunit beta [Clostridiales bacterium]|jgi:indolepyruvate ferredoxin oxidoreductase beta subunit|nr:indolepyruvate oxidoreductase subunit beta [Clostridiales bacterium]